MNKTLLKITLGLIAILSFNTTYAQDAESLKEAKVEKESPFTFGADLVSAYVWRGTKFSGPSIQPTLEYGISGFTIGAWGSFDFTNGFNELDTYASYTFGFGLGLGVTDYYYQGSRAFDFADTTGSHALEANLNYTIGGFSASANYVINDTHAGGPGSKGGDLYFELGYGFKYLDVFVGGGDGWHTANGNFNIVNVGIGVTKEIKITETFSVPVFAQLIVNPDKEEYDLVIGISL
jgi:hypothetical protein